jgi:hypothetical protein
MGYFTECRLRKPVTFLPDVRIDEADTPDCVEKDTKVRCLYIGAEANKCLLLCFLILKPVRDDRYARIGILKLRTDEAKEHLTEDIVDTVILI